MRTSLGKFLSAAALVFASLAGVANAGVVISGSWDPKWSPSESSFASYPDAMWWNGSFQLDVDACVFGQGAGSHLNGSCGLGMSVMGPGVTVKFTLNENDADLDTYAFSPMSIVGYNLDGSGNIIAIDTGGPSGFFFPSGSTFSENQYNFNLGFDNLGTYMEAFSNSPYENAYGCNYRQILSSAEPMLVTSMSALAVDPYVMPTYTTSQPEDCFSRSDVTFSKFDVRVVPEPSVLALIGAALLARGLMRRKQRPVRI